MRLRNINENYSPIDDEINIIRSLTDKTRRQINQCLESFIVFRSQFNSNFVVNTMTRSLPDRAADRIGSKLSCIMEYGTVPVRVAGVELSAWRGKVKVPGKNCELPVSNQAL